MSHFWGDFTFPSSTFSSHGYRVLTDNSWCLPQEVRCSRYQLAPPSTQLPAPGHLVPSAPRECLSSSPVTYKRTLPGNLADGHFTSAKCLEESESLLLPGNLFVFGRRKATQAPRYSPAQDRYLFRANCSQHQTVDFMFNLDTALSHATGAGRGTFNSFQVCAQI